MNIPHVSEYTVNSSHDRSSRSTGYPTINGKRSTFRDVVSTMSRSNSTNNNRMTHNDWLYLDKLHREFHNM